MKSDCTTFLGGITSSDKRFSDGKKCTLENEKSIVKLQVATPFHSRTSQLGFLPLPRME